MRVILAEIVCSGVHGYVGLGQLRVQFVSQLLLAVGVVQMLEVAARVISRPELQLYILAIDLDLETPEVPILQGIGARETQNVIRGSVFLHLRKYAAEVIVVEKGFSAGVIRERGESVLRVRVAIEIVENVD